MRIVHVVQRFHPVLGGAESYVREIGLEQSRRGHEVTVVTTLPPQGAVSEEVLVVRGGRVRVVRFPTRHVRGDYFFPPWLPMRGASEFLAREPVDLLHGHSYRFDTIEQCARASRARGVPFVASALGFYPPENLAVALSRLAYDRGRGRRALQQARLCVALTRDEIPHYEALGVPARRVAVVPPGLLPEALEPGDGARFRREHDLGGSVVLFLARLAHDKGLPDLVAAMARVPEATLAVVGPDAGAKAGALRRARRLGILDRVRFLGPVASTRDAYAACDVFVHPSHYEAFGMVIVEAQAQGKPVVATTAGGCPEAGGPPATLVAPRAPKELAGAIRKLLADPERRRALGERGRERARGFVWSTLGDRLEEVYARALE